MIKKNGTAIVRSKKKSTKKKPTRKVSTKSRSQWILANTRSPTEKDCDDFGRVLAWDGKMSEMQSADQLDHDMLWQPAAKAPTKADLKKVEAAKRSGAGQ